jgi:hypothetical protein
MARFRACDCRSIAPGVLGTQAIAAAVIENVPGTFLKSASYRLTEDGSPDILPRGLWVCSGIEDGYNLVEVELLLLTVESSSQANGSNLVLGMVWLYVHMDTVYTTSNDSPSTLSTSYHPRVAGMY